MANDLNKWMGIGRLGKEVDVRYLPSGSAVANFSIACSRSWKDKQTGAKQEETEWVNVVAFGKLGEICGEYLRKGSQVYIEGRLKTEKYQKDGIDRYSTKVIADNMQMLGSVSQNNNNGPSVSQNANREAQRQIPPQQPGGHDVPDFDDKIPW